MVSINEWGPHCWVFFHVIILKINPDCFEKVWRPLLSHLQNICSNLPCPSCSKHAQIFFSRQKRLEFKNKEEFAEFIWFFHNYVNSSKKKAHFPLEKMGEYNAKKLDDSYRQFLRVYNSKDTSLKMLNESFRRRLISKTFHTWILTNRKCFFN
jgi:hypothetical protein